MRSQPPSESRSDLKIEFVAKIGKVAESKRSGLLVFGIRIPKDVVDRNRDVIVRLYENRIPVKVTIEPVLELAR